MSENTTYQRVTVVSVPEGDTLVPAVVLPSDQVAQYMGIQGVYMRVPCLVEAHPVYPCNVCGAQGCLNPTHVYTVAQPTCPCGEASFPGALYCEDCLSDPWMDGTCTTCDGLHSAAVCPIEEYRYSDEYYTDEPAF